MALTDTPRVLAGELLFPEGPRWDGSRFVFSDIHAHRVIAVDLEGRSQVLVELDDRPSGLGFMPDGSLLVVGMLDRRLWRVAADGSRRLHADLASLCEDFVNDMVVDSRGRAYVGSRTGRPGPEPDEIILVEPDGGARVVAQLKSPNGTVVTPDGTTLTVAETHIGRLTSYTIADDGSLVDRRTFAEVPGYTFDGICLDAEGNVWAGAGTKGLVCVGPGGRLLAEKPPWDEYHVTACVFGGPERRHLLMCTAVAPRGMFEQLGKFRERDAGSPSRGRVSVVELEVAGAGIP